jgi:winged helix DNA-binding protein
MGAALADGAHLATASRDRLIVSGRLAAQLLSGPPARSPVAVAERLLAVQGQDPRGARLAVRVRSRGLHASDVDRALSVERSLVIDWLNRGTLHLVRSEDHGWLRHLTAPGLMRGCERRLEQEGLSPAAREKGVRVIARSLEREGPLTRAQLGERVERAGVANPGQALIHLLYSACIRGIALRGPMVGRQHAYVLRRDWLGEAPAPARDTALRELARRYLAGHAPASERDLARWSGLPLRDARTGLAALGRRVSVRHDGLLELATRRDPSAEPPTLPAPRLLGAFDPVLHGWCSRAEILGAHQPLVAVGGVFRPFALVAGRGVATWKLDRGRVVLEPFGRLRAADRRELEADGREVESYLGPAALAETAR